MCHLFCTLVLLLFVPRPSFFWCLGYVVLRVCCSSVVSSLILFQIQSMQSTPPQKLNTPAGLQR